MKRRFAAIALAAMMLLCLLPVTALAADHPLADGESLDISACAAGDTVTVAAGASVTITGTKAVQIVCGAGAEVTLNGVTIDVSGTDYACPLAFTGSGNKLILDSGTTNTLTAGKYEPGVRVEDTTELTISGSGTLDATGGSCGAGIGGGRSSSGGDITIDNGTIISEGKSAAGIGGGYSSGAASITINGGDVTATAYDNSAGIGGAMDHGFGTITITGGNVTATSLFDSAPTGAGIGSGVNGDGGTIIISGGNVTASSGHGGAGIGCGYGSGGAAIQITGGVISATGSNGGGDIGSGAVTISSASTLSLDGCAEVTMNANGARAAVTLGNVYIMDKSTGSDTIADGYYVNGILFTGTVINMSTGAITGSGALYTSPQVTVWDPARGYLITGSTTNRCVVVSTGTTTATDIILFGTSVVFGSDCAFDMTGSNVELELCGSNKLSSGDDYAGLQCPDGAAVTITGDGSLTATGGEFGAGIGGGLIEDSGNIVIQGGDIHAQGGYLGAGIGGGSGGSGRINISGTADVTATGGNSAAGIGGGYGSDGGSINISDSAKVTATGGDYAAGIGGGCDDGSGDNDGGSITISGGEINANGGTHGAGIGGGGDNGGSGGDGGTINISGGHVTASGGHEAAGIGSGYDASGGTIQISGGSVIASGGSNGAGIGGGNHGIGGSINISGSADVTATGGLNAAGIGGGYSKSGGTITISDSADVHAQGGSYGAGIGGGDGGDDYGVDSDGGDITISGGTVTSSGGSYGAGIGGGDYGRGGDIRISGGIVKAYGANYSAGIGSGRDADGGTINISGTADVTATGGMGAAGIGGGDGDSGGVINISGGKVTATGGTSGMNMGAGIGSGSAAGDITISGGIVFATGAGGSAKDIGNGSDGSGGTLSISGDAAVFMKNDRYIAPDTSTHTHLEYTTDTEESYGYDIPSAWTPTFGAFIRLHTLSYNVNGGSGTVSDAVTQLYNTTAAVAGGTGLSRTNYEFDGWNTAANGSGTSYAAGSTFTFAANTTLYVKWKGLPELSSSDADGKIYTGGRVTLTPNIAGGTWDYDSAYFSREGNTFTALKAGTSTITYTADGGSITYDVTIEASGLPATGQDFAWVWALSGAAALATAAGVYLRRRTVKSR